MKPEYIWSLLTLACLAGLGGLGFGLFVRLRTRRLLQRIENMLESALAGDFRESDFDETQLSKLESMLFRLLSAGATSEKNLLQEKERISALVSDISVGMQQRVEILKMLYRDNEILIFDEPTAVLTPQEIDELMDIMRGLAEEGKSILFISHKLAEIMAVADRCSVLRKG